MHLFDMEGQEKMKQPKRLPRNLKIAVSAYGLNPDNWMLLKDDGGEYVTIVHKSKAQMKIIDRNARPKKGEQR